MQAPVLHKAKTQFEYARQTDEELSFGEDTILEVYDVSDPDWYLVGLDGEYGFAPANYTEKLDDQTSSPSVAQSTPVLASQRASDETQTPAAALAGALKSGVRPPKSTTRAVPGPISPQRALPELPDSEEAAPQRVTPKQRQASDSTSSIRALRSEPRERQDDTISPPSQPDRAPVAQEMPTPGRFHLYNVNEMLSAMGKQKKMPTILGINLGTGSIMISAAKTNATQQHWTGEKLAHYSIEGKHVFLELVKPSRSIDFHAGAKDTAREIVSALGELAGAVRAEGLREVLAIGQAKGSSTKRGVILYDFTATDTDEVDVAAGDEVIILDDTKSEEWWQVRRLKCGKEGVVPSSFVERKSTPSIAASTLSPLESSKSRIERNRLDEERLTREVTKTRKSKGDGSSNSGTKGKRASEVGPGLKLPLRGSSLLQPEDEESESAATTGSKDERKGSASSNAPKTKPDMAKTRTWTDRSGSFKVDAQFLGCSDGKIHLHKLNGVKIAVPVVKMSMEDLEYVERQTGQSLDDDKPLVDMKQKSRNAKDLQSPSQLNGASIQSPTKAEYDWFDFFLKAGIDVQLCQRYASGFSRENMDESVLSDIEQSTLRTLGLREGDIIRVMRYLNQLYGRSGSPGANADSANGSAGGGLFSGPGGQLRNNTRKGRPAPPVITSDRVDPAAFEVKEAKAGSSAPSKIAAASGSGNAKDEGNFGTNGFEDHAWETKPTKAPEKPKAEPAAASSAVKGPTSPAPVVPLLTPSMQELSLLSAPLQPTKAEPSVSAANPAPASGLMGANPAFFDQISQPQPLIAVAARQRPQAPAFQPSANSLIPPPPQRITSAPIRSQAAAMVQLSFQGQQTGYPNGYGQMTEVPQGMQQQPQQLSQMYPQNTGMIPNGTGPGPTYQLPSSIPQSLYPQMTGYQPNLQPQLNPQATGYQYAPYNQFQPPNGPSSIPSASPPPTGPINAFMPPALQPQPTGPQFQPPTPQHHTHIPGSLPPFQPQPTGQYPGPPQQQQQQRQQQQQQANGFHLQPQQTGFSGPLQSLNPLSRPPLPPVPISRDAGATMAPLMPQKTGPAPAVRFGVEAGGAAAKRLVPQPTGRRANLAQATPQNPFGFE